MRRTGAAALLTLGALAGCREEAAPMLQPPPGFARPDELPFGDAALAAENRALLPILDALEPRYGRARVDRYTAEQTLDPRAIRAHYARSAEGWSPLAVPAHGDVFAYARDGRALAVVVLPLRPGNERRFVTVARFGDGDRG